MKLLIQYLSTLNNFSVILPPPERFVSATYPIETQKLVAQNLAGMQGPAVIVDHFNFVNFTQFGLPKPIYINLVRDPVERVISSFYFKRTAWGIWLRQSLYPEERPPAVEYLKKDLETCLRTGDFECKLEQGILRLGDRYTRQMPYFCGHNQAECLPLNGRETMQIAKRNVEENYAVVGTWADVNITLTVFEKYIPRYFQTAFTLYHAFRNGELKVNTNTFHPKPSESVKQLIRQNMTNEIEFYEFCRQRLHKQYLALNIDPNFI